MREVPCNHAQGSICMMGSDVIDARRQPLLGIQAMQHLAARHEVRIGDMDDLQRVCRGVFIRQPRRSYGFSTIPFTLPR